MDIAASFLRKIQLLTSLSLLVWISLLNTLNRVARNCLLRLLAYVNPGVRADTGPLASSYELMQERLRDSLQEIEEKNKQLEESREQIRKSRDFLQTVIDSLDEDLLVLDSEQHIIQANRSLHLKHKDREVVGHHC